MRLVAHVGQSDSFFTLFYPRDSTLWNDHVGPEDAMESWLRADRQGAMAPYITDNERVIHQKIMQGNHGPALKWYRVLVNNLNRQDEVESRISPEISCPVLMLFPAQIADQFSAANNTSSGFADDLSVKGVSTSGHWLQLEARDEVNAILKEFFERKVHEGAIPL